MRGWHELVGRVGDLLPVPLLGAGLLLLTTIAAMLWYFWPDWLPGRRSRSGRGAGAGTSRRRSGSRRGRARAALRRLVRLLRPTRWRLKWRWRWRWRRRRVAAQPFQDLPADALPDLPAATLTLTADELAAAGRYKEAVRERLRAIVRELVERAVIDYRPGWTVTELAEAAGTARPAAAAPLRGASDIFSGIWYGRRPAGAAEDAAMRQHAAAVRAAVEPAASPQEVPA